MKRKKIAVVNQRYGLEVNGGSEYHARLLAEQLSKKYEVEVITTCARDYNTWGNYYPSGLDTVNGIPVRRFRVERMREKKRFRWLDRARKYIPFTWSALEQKWVDEQGSYAPEAIAYIREHQKDYDVFIFVTYLYYLTVRGLPEVADRSILIPTAHDEPFLKMRIYEKLFRAPRGYFFNTEEEKQLVYQTFGTEAIPSAVGGLGIEVPEVTKPENFQKNIIWAAISCMSEGWTEEKTASSYSGIFCGIKDKAGRISSWC